MALKTKRFDASKYIESREAEAALWADAVESGHPGVIASALGSIAKARGMSQLAAETGLSRQALYAGLSDDGNPTLDTVLKVTKALGLGLTAAPAVAAEKAAPAVHAIGVEERDVHFITNQVIEDTGRYWLQGSTGLNAVLRDKSSVLMVANAARVAGGVLHHTPAKEPAKRAKKLPALAGGGE